MKEIKAWFIWNLSCFCTVPCVPLLNSCQWPGTHALVSPVALSVLRWAGHEGDHPNRQDILMLLPYGWPQTVQQGKCFLNQTQLTGKMKGCAVAWLWKRQLSLAGLEAFLCSGHMPTVSTALLSLPRYLHLQGQEITRQAQSQQCLSLCRHCLGDTLCVAVGFLKGVVTVFNSSSVLTISAAHMSWEQNTVYDIFYIQILQNGKLSVKTFSTVLLNKHILTCQLGDTNFSWIPAQFFLTQPSLHSQLT